MRDRVICAPSSWREISSAPSVVVTRGGWRSGPRPGTCAMNADRRSCGLALRWPAADGEGDGLGSRLSTLKRARSLSSSLKRAGRGSRSEEHTSELQSRGHLVCRRLRGKKNRKYHDD